MVYDIDTMDDAALLEWANSLGICSFRRGEDAAGREAAVCEGDRVRIALQMGRFDDGCGTPPGGVYVGVDAEDRRHLYSASGNPCGYLDEAERCIEGAAKRLGLYTGQLTLF